MMLDHYRVLNECMIANALSKLATTHHIPPHYDDWADVESKLDLVASSFNSRSPE